MNRQSKRRLSKGNNNSDDRPSSAKMPPSQCRPSNVHPIDPEVIDLVSCPPVEGKQDDINVRSGSPLLGSEPEVVINVEDFKATKSDARGSNSGNSSDTIDLTDSPTTFATVRLTDKVHRRRIARASAKSPHINSNLSSSQQCIDDDDDDFPQILPNFSLPSLKSKDRSPSKSPGKQRIQCPICLDNEKQITLDHRHLVSTTCGHIYCNICINQAVKESHKCPKCRKRLTLHQLHPIYL